MMNDPQQIPANISGLAPSPNATAAQTTADEMTSWMQTGEAASPEEQAAYDAIVSYGLRLISNPKADVQMVEQIRSAANPAEGMGFVSGLAFRRALTEARKQGGVIPEEAVLPAATEIYENVVDMAQTAGVKEASDQQTIDNGYFHALDQARLTLEEMGMITPEKAAEELAELKALQANGGLPQIGAPQGGEAPSAPVGGSGFGAMGARR